MKRTWRYRLFLALLVTLIFSSSIPNMALAAINPLYQGGLLDNQPLSYGSAVGVSLGTVTKVTDSDPSTYEKTSSSNPYMWFDFASPRTIDAYAVTTSNAGGYIKLQFYDSSGTKLAEIQLVSNNQGKKVQLGSPLSNVKRVAIYGKGSYNIYELNVFSSVPTSPSDPPTDPDEPSNPEGSIYLARGVNTPFSSSVFVNYDDPRLVTKDDLLPYGYSSVSNFT